MEEDKISSTLKEYASMLEGKRSDVIETRDTLDIAIEEQKIRDKTLKDAMDEVRYNTDFKAEGITNEPGRVSYINKQESVIDAQTKVDDQNLFVISCRNDLEDAKEELYDARLLIRLEIALRKDVGVPL